MKIVKKLYKLIIDIIFPTECLGCGKENEWLCYDCLNEISIKQDQTCPVCRTIANGATCKNCTGRTSLDGLLVSTNYDQQVIQSTIHTLKYNYIAEAADCLSGLINKFLITFDKQKNLDILYHSGAILSTVPLNKKRLLERGFNQSELMAKNIAWQFQMPFMPNLLQRKRYTAAQAQLTKKQRLDNIKNAFTLNKSFKISGKNVIIIDDVATTLATLEECAKALKQAGAQQVWGLVIARGG